jgi:hypothetical protein
MRLTNCYVCRICKLTLLSNNQAEINVAVFLQFMNGEFVLVTMLCVLQMR